ncbi:MAG: redoxin domain-containing protein [Pelobium sp.]
MKSSLIIALLLITKFGFASNQLADSLKLGQKLEGFTLENTVKGQSEKVSLSDYKDQRGAIIVFMTNGCHHCILYRDRIKAFQTKYASKGYPLITINPSPTYAPEETLELMQKNASKENYDFPYLRDPDQNIALKYFVHYTPEVYILKKKGEDWILQYVGPIDDDMENKKKDKLTYVDNVMNAILNHQKLPEYSVSK